MLCPPTGKVTSTHIHCLCPNEELPLIYLMRRIAPAYKGSTLYIIGSTTHAAFHQCFELEFDATAQITDEASLILFV